ncbi:hypothetical protein B0T22DRAFT_283140 [Podospora appendiculata]|uniref:DUF2461 domain-containing protein n=1 Tax=Podospora appendiculata TaxID=314037 RepID=A0AAE0X188_9PEZI|nr:hypothetical protein B0T22DRAFT_283140 [Podospora appendiculata]
MPPGRKRKATAAPAAQENAPTTPGASRRRSTRIETSANKRSKYFVSDSEPDLDSEFDGGHAIAAKSAQAPASGGKRGRGRPKKVKEPTPEPEDEDDYKDELADDDDDDEEENGARRKAGNDDDDDDDDDDIDEDAPPKVTFIPHVKLRDTGGIDYADDRLHHNTLEFLKDLKANNQRKWLKSNDEEFRRSLKDWESWVTTMTDKIIEADETIPELPFKDVNFRIYRDIRFSKDPTPYKPHYGAAWSRTGRKGPYACYYIHAEPGKCMVGGGLWHPDGEAVQKLRASIDERPRRWRRVLMDPAFRRTFLSGGAARPATAKGKKKGKGKAAQDDEDEDEKAVLKAFAATNAENALKTKPKGFPAEHRDIELLKLRNFTVMKKLPDSAFTSERGQDEMADIIRAMVGFVTHLNRIVMPDPGDDDESDEDDGNDEEG